MGLEWRKKKRQTWTDCVRPSQAPTSINCIVCPSLRRGPESQGPVRLVVCRGLETQIGTRLSISLSRSWNSDRNPSVHLSIEVLKLRSGPVCPSLCRGLETQIGTRLSISLSRSWNSDRGPVSLSGGFCSFVCPFVRGSLVSLFCDRGYIFVGEGAGY
jgi:hypothetical protein